MKKRIAAILTAAMMMLVCGCGSNNDSTTSADTQAVTEADAGTEAETEGDADTEEQPVSTTKSISMSVNRSDGKMSISRAAKKDTSMGEADTWTIFVYLCGTDLESSGQGSATSDLQQMLSAEKSDNVKFVIQTGGTSQWINDYFSTEACERWVVQNGDMEKVDTVDLSNMGAAETLSGFLDWGVQNYPAAKMGLIFWDHGGGSISGVCVDELNEGDTLSLSEINEALSQSYQNMTDKFEFIGFDCCLMGTIETANMLATYARYFYGSQETEPGSGWDYTTYGTYLAQNPGASGADLGKVIVDSFYDECASSSQEAGSTLTVVDLDKVDEFTVAFNDYAQNLYTAAQSNLSGVVRGINQADNFGGNNQSEGYTNMVDIGGIINNCSGYADGTEVLSALQNCIVYNKNGSDHTNASGLSIYYPLKVEDSKDLKTLSGICISPYYLSLVDMVAKGYSETGYNNDGLFSEDGEWTVEDGQSSISDDTYFNYADEEGEKDSKLITFAAEPAVQDGNYKFQLDESGLGYATTVSAFLSLQIDDENAYMIGETDDVEADWETGIFSDKFDGYWLSLPNGTVLETFIVESTDEYTVYVCPINLNGKATNLRVRQYPDYSTVIEGAWDGIGENGMASREVKQLAAGDQIEPRYMKLDDTEDKGEAYTWAEGDSLTYNKLPEGTYLYSFCIEDAYGDTLITDPVVFTVDAEGQIAFAEE